VTQRLPDEGGDLAVTFRERPHDCPVSEVQTAPPRIAAISFANASDPPPNHI
jgi:hypothetical protein